MIKNLIVAGTIASLAMTGVAAAQTTGGMSSSGSNTSGAGAPLPGYPGTKQTRVTGVVVDLLSYVTRVGTRGELYTGNNNGSKNGGGANGTTGNEGNHNEGAPTANGGNSGKGGNNGGNGGGNGGGVLRPLGIVTTGGHVYMIDLPASHAGLEGRLSSTIGETTTLLGRVFVRGGQSVMVVDAMV